MNEYDTAMDLMQRKERHSRSTVALCILCIFHDIQSEKIAFEYAELKSRTIDHVLFIDDNL